MQTLTYLEDRGQAATVSKSNTTTPAGLGTAFRYCDDIGPRQAAAIATSLGGDAARILEVGYGIATVSFARALNRSEPMKHGTIVLPVRDAHGAIVGLHDHRLQWLTSSAMVHVVNAARARYADIKIYDTTAQADSVSLAENVCCVARNGADDRAVEAAVLAALRLTHPYYSEFSDIIKRAARLTNPNNPNTIKEGETAQTARVAA